MLIKEIDNNSDKYLYKYDKLNNITHIYHNDILENRYYYNEDNELIKENNHLLNQTIRYKYDNLGNLLYKKVYELNTDNLLRQDKYEYNNLDWCDQLTNFNDNIITYDKIGNPLTIGDITLNWINGRQLNSYIDSNNNISYKYNEEGIRISKNINGTETKYYLEGSSIILEKTGDNVLYYLYNGVDDLVGFKYNNNIYYYVKNNQGDIIGILDSNYNIVAKYTYDSWGNIISIVDSNSNDVSSDSTHIANINPFRYRSYYYDSETKLYYLNSRYYNPSWGRFLNIDSIIDSNNDIISYNLYVYCSNNPVNNKDSLGKGWIKNLWSKIKESQTIKKVVNAFVNVVNKIVSTSYSSNKNYEKKYGGAVINYKHGTNVTKTETTGDNNSLFTVEHTVTNANILNPSTKISTNADIFNVSLEYNNNFEIESSVSLTIGSREYSFGVGFESGAVYIKNSINTDIGNGVTNGYYNQISVNALVAVTVAVTAYFFGPIIIFA